MCLLCRMTQPAGPPVLSVWGVSRHDTTFYDLELEGGRARYEEGEVPKPYWGWAREYFKILVDRNNADLPRISVALEEAETALQRKTSPDIVRRFDALQVRLEHLMQQRQDAKRKADATTIVLQQA
jgi:hypothetical protein